MNRLREMSRHLRRLPVVRHALEKSDPRRRIARIIAAGIVDPVLYAAQLGVDEMSTAEAAKHYIRWGYRHGYAVNILIDNFVLKQNMPGTPRPLAYDYIASAEWNTPVSPVWDPASYLAEHPEARQHPGGPVGHLWGRVQSDPQNVKIPIQDASGVRTVAWTDLYQDALQAISAWSAARADRRRRRPNSWMKKPTEALPVWDSAKTQPLVSIVMPAWNRSGGVRVAADSVLAQTWTNWELLIVDDGSWDDTAAIAQLLAHRDQRIRFIPRDHSGVSATRNAGIDAARGEYIAFLDSDNEWQPLFLETMVSSMVEEGDTVAFATIELVYEDRVGYRQSEPTHDSLLLGNSVDLNSLVVRADALTAAGNFDTALPRAVDFDLILRLAEKNRIRHIPVLGAIYDNREESADRISTTEPMGWNTYVRLRAQVSWDELREKELLAGTHVIAILNRRDENISHKLKELLLLSEDPSFSVLVAFIAPTREEWMSGAAARLGRPDLDTQLFVERESFSYAVNMCLTKVRRTGTLVLGPRALFDADSVRKLANAAEPTSRRVVIPTNVTPQGVLVGVGSVQPKRGAAPEPILSGHPLSDAKALGTTHKIPALHGESFAMPTADLVKVQGLSPLLYNQFELPALSSALSAEWPDYEFVVRTDVVWRQFENGTPPRVDPMGNLRALTTLMPEALGDAAELYAELGQKLAHWEYLTAADGESRMRPVIHRAIATSSSIPRLRWALKIASPFGPVGETWGDTHFARSLARALERLGQEVVIDYHDAHSRETAYIDDVSLVIRGLDVHVTPTAGINMLWVISHPEMVTRAEASKFDLVFAASDSWARRQSSRWGRTVTPLLQCTDPELFRPTQRTRTQDIVFVGNSRHIARPAVLEPLRAGIPLVVYGGDWEQFISPDSIAATSVPNAEVPALYESASVVLNDHWRDMQREGFMSNRLFDVVAACGRVLSDRVDGIDKVFGKAVATYNSPAELVSILEGDLTAAFPTESEIAETSEYIRREHSFDARARVLIDAAIACRDS
ncbi:glycosyltransferase involved in cell wall biosynthesis [Microbacterium endophyticum]|uniref:Glycosyltransferase involved in cell wall biosynthesis n=1 Tax=Microbacterium endophyticum TaxID=1526412 RepID=A0A7W4V3R1_9MICO|nr:glycosyltransferase [Microbacterium endophyticum]MBB2976333.1 glycosyltransferase involved in cell wall biosynthesis [Microbacterium endophyticum]NIK35213.1 glycosyltransferase involved in cell wall biosynthesis [Microbacterium endophyticum]